MGRRPTSCRSVSRLVDRFATVRWLLFPMVKMTASRRLTPGSVRTIASSAHCPPRRILRYGLGEPDAHLCIYAPPRGQSGSTSFRSRYRGRSVSTISSTSVPVGTSGQGPCPSHPGSDSAPDRSRWGSTHDRRDRRRDRPGSVNGVGTPSGSSRGRVGVGPSRRTTYLLQHPAKCHSPFRSRSERPRPRRALAETAGT